MPDQYLTASGAPALYLAHAMSSICVVCVCTNRIKDGQNNMY